MTLLDSMLVAPFSRRVVAAVARVIDALAAWPAKRLAWFVFVVALLPRLWLLLLYPNLLRYPDEEVYLMLAQSLLANGEYEVGWLDIWSNNQFSGAGLPPMQPFVILMGLAMGGGGIWAPKLILALLGAGTAGLTSLLGNRLFGGRAAVVAGLVCAVYPFLLFVNNTLFPQTLAGFLLLLVILALVPPAGHSPRRILGGGLALGALILAVPAFAPLAPMFAFWLIWGVRRMGDGWVRAVGMAAVLSLGASAVVLPWTVRTSLRYREFILVSACSTVPFWEGNLGEYPRKFVRELRPLSPMQREAYLHRLARERIQARPAEFARRVVKKYVAFFGFWDRQLIQNRYSGVFYKTLGALTSAPILLGALLGLRRALRANPNVRWVVATVLLTALIYALFLAKIRYRLTIEPLLILAAAVASVPSSPSSETKRDV